MNPIISEGSAHPSTSLVFKGGVLSRADPLLGQAAAKVLASEHDVETAQVSFAAGQVILADLAASGYLVPYAKRSRGISGYAITNGAGHNPAWSNGATVWERQPRPQLGSISSR